MTQKNSMIKHYILALLGVAAGIFLDQYTKLLAIRYLKDSSSFSIWKGVFELEYLENRGAAFGLLQNKRYFFVISTIIMLLIAVYVFIKIPKTGRYLPLRICTIFLTAGAAGNFIDRLYRGYVVDFFYFSLIDFPVFNVADIYVTVTFAVLVLLLFFYYKEDELDFLSPKKKNRDGKEGL